MGAPEWLWGTQAAALVAYAAAFFTGHGRRLPWAARVGVGIAWAATTAWLLHQWHAAGLLHPPWSTARGALALGSWALMGAQLVAELRWQAGEAGILQLALATACGASGLWLAKDVAGTGPQWANPWLCAWLPLGAWGFSFFLLSSFESCLALLKAGVPTDRLLSALAAASLLSLAWAYPQLPSGPWPLAAPAALAGLAAYLLASACALWLESYDRRARDARVRAGATSAPGAPAEAPAPPGTSRAATAVLRLLLTASWLAFVVVLWAALREPARGPRAAVFGWLLFLAFVDGVALLLSWRRPAVEEGLPELEHLARASQAAAACAFPGLTAYGVAGAVLASELRGDSWSQPALGWSFAAWVYLALLLHLKAGRLSTAVAAAGGAFLAVIAAAGVLSAAGGGVGFGG